MIRVSFNGKSELITASLTSRHSLLPLLGSMKRALRNLGALKDRGPSARRPRRRRNREREAVIRRWREPTCKRRIEIAE